MGHPFYVSVTFESSRTLNFCCSQSQSLYHMCCSCLFPHLPYYQRCQWSLIWVFLQNDTSWFTWLKELYIFKGKRSKITFEGEIFFESFSMCLIIPLMSVITLAGPSDSVPTAEKVVIKGDMNYIVSKISEPNYEN